MEEQDLEIDQTRLEKILFLKESHVYQLNPVVSQDIGKYSVIDSRCLEQIVNTCID